MAYTIEINRRSVSYHNDEGLWLEGDTRLITDYGQDVRTYEPAYDDVSPIAWAVEVISNTDAREPSIDPIPELVHAGAWLSGSYQLPASTEIEETTVRVTGEFTDWGRAEIFRRVSAL